jgi:hypothetical protein
MNKIIYCLILLISSPLFGTNITEIKCNNKVNPVGIDKYPFFSWIIQSNNRNEYQTAFQIIVADNLSSLKKNKANCWNSGKVFSDKSININYLGKPLEAGKKYFWKVRIWNKINRATDWSNYGTFVTALFDSTDWKNAKWIGYEDIPDSLILAPGIEPYGKNVKNIALRRPVIPYFRKEFSSVKKIQSAYLFICGLGHYKAYINGIDVSDNFLSPGWTFYQKACLYNTYEITQYLKNGKNAIGVIVGNGFYNINNERYRKLLTTHGMPKLICNIKIYYTDGSIEYIVSDESWKTSPSPLLFTSIYGGEEYDAQLNQEGWNNIDFDDKNWKNAIYVRKPSGKLKPEYTYPIKANEVFYPVKILKIDENNYLYDFAQNSSGIIEIKLKGKRGDKIKIYPGELVNDKNYVNQRATGKPYYFEYTLKGQGEESYTPFFTYYGFRYVQIENAVPSNEINNKNKPVVIDIKMLHTYNSAPRNGSFLCSNELINKINRLIIYAIQSNFQSVLTDCPHREKLGWLEQTYLMGNAVFNNFDIYHLYSKIIDDMMDAQLDNGLVPDIAPEYVIFNNGFRDSPEWGSASIQVPWLVYKLYHDTSVLQKAWPMMVKYLNYLINKSDNYLLNYGLGDWYDLGPKRPGTSQLTPVGLTATAIFYYDAIILSKIADILNMKQHKENFSLLAENIKKSFNNKFFNSSAFIYSTGSQTAMAMPLYVGLVDDIYYQKVYKNLIDSINKINKSLTAGDIGFHFLVETLLKNNENQLLYDMINRDDVPGYGFQIKKGATALTESWQALENVSNNHLMLGHIIDFFYKGIGGISQSENSVAFKEITIKPAFIDGINENFASINSPYGKISTNWKKEKNKIFLSVEIPVNTNAILYLPINAKNIKEKNRDLKNIKDINLETTETNLIIKIGSGYYNFVFEK